MSGQSRSLRRQSRQQQAFDAGDVEQCLQQSLAEESATALLFAEQDFQGHGDQFSAYLKDDFHISTSEHAGNIPTPTVPASEYFNGENQSSVDQILGSPYPSSSTQQQSGLAGNLDTPGFFDKGLSQGTADDNAATQEPWNPFQDRWAMTGHQALMPPPGKRLRTDSGYSTITQQNLQQQPRQSSGSVVSAPAAHYPEPMSAGAFSQAPSIPLSQTSSHYVVPGPGVQIARSHDEMSTTSRSDAGHGFPGHCCGTAFKNESSRKKHIAKHERPFRCKFADCTYSEVGFTTQNDLDRHRKTFHKIILPTDLTWKCLYPGCSKQSKYWPRRDNFKAHLTRIHTLKEKEAEEYIKKAEQLWECESKADNDVPMLDDQTSVMQPNEMHKDFSRPITEPPASGLRIRTSISSKNRVDGDIHMSNSPSVLVTPSTFSEPQYTQDQWTSIGSRHEGSGKRKNRGEEPNIDMNASFQRSAVQNASIFQPGTSLPPAAFHNPSFPQLSLVNPFLGPGLMPLPDKAFASYSVAAPGETAERHRHLTNEHKEDLFFAKQYREGSSEADFAAMGDGVDQFLVNDDDMTAAQQNEDISLDFGRDLPAQDSMVTNFGNFTLSEMLKLPHDDRLAYAKLLMRGGPANASNQPASISQQSGQADNSKYHKCSKSVKGKDGTIRPCGKRYDKSHGLKKHMKRHEMRFACTFDCPDKRFATKHEWRRHEQNQHEQYECWKCDQCDSHDVRDCVFHEREDFKRHLAESHKLDEAVIHDKTLRCRIARKFQGQFWCGFCLDVVQNDARMGTEKDKRRYDHIHAHLNGGFDMSQWLPLTYKGRSFTRSGTDGTTDDSNITVTSVIEDEEEEDNFDEQQEDDEDSRFETSASPLGTFSTTATSNRNFNVSKRPYASQQDSMYSTTTRKNTLSVPGSGYMQRPRASSDGGQHRLLRFSQFICCKCGHGRQQLGRNGKCEVCRHQLPCSSCDIFDTNGKRLRDLAEYNLSGSLELNQSLKMQIEGNT